MTDGTPAEPGPTTRLPEGVRPRYPRTATHVGRLILQPRVLVLVLGVLLVVGALVGLGLPSWAATPLAVGVCSLILSAAVTRDAEARHRGAEAARQPSDADLREVPLPTRRALRGRAVQMWSLFLAGLAVAALGVLFAVRPPEDEAGDRGSLPEWGVRLLAAAVVIGTVFAFRDGLRQWRRRRAVQRLIEAGEAPRQGGVVVGESGNEPVVELPDGVLVSLGDGGHPMGALTRGDAVVIDGPVLDGHPVAVTFRGRAAWAKARLLPRIVVVRDVPEGAP